MFGVVERRDLSLREAEEQVRSGLAAFPEDLSTLDDGEIEAGMARLRSIAQAAEAMRLRWLAEFERRRSYRADGFLSGAAWLADRFGVTGAEATHEVRTAQALEEMPEAREAFSGGQISSFALRTLMAVRDTHPAEFAQAEGTLVDAATTCSAGELRRVVEAWSASLDETNGADRTERLRERRYLKAYPLVNGMIRLDGELDPESGETVVTALRAIQDAEARSMSMADSGTGVQRQADAMVALARSFLDSASRPSVAGTRPHVTVTVDLQALRGRSGKARLTHAGAVSSSVAQRLACDGEVSRIVLGPRSEPLDVGRTTRVVPPHLRRAVEIRDGRCAFPGYGRPPPWCDAHHVVHWARGGRTALPNLVLLCRPHHRAVHEGGFRVEMIEGRPAFQRPDGSPPNAGRAPP